MFGRMVPPHFLNYVIIIPISAKKKIQSKNQKTTKTKILQKVLYEVNRNFAVTIYLEKPKKGKFSSLMFNFHSLIY